MHLLRTRMHKIEGPLQAVTTAAALSFLRKDPRQPMTNECRAEANCPAQELEAWPKPRIAAQTCHSACKRQRNRYFCWLPCLSGSSCKGTYQRWLLGLQPGGWCNRKPQPRVLSMRSILEAPLLQRAVELWELRAYVVNTARF